MGWKTEWITAAEEIVREEFKRSYADRAVDDSVVEIPPPAVDKKVSTKIFAFLYHDLTQTKTINIFDNLPSLLAPGRSELHDELARYLSTDTEQVNDVLLWWHEKKATFPCLSRMALDYLTIPGTRTNSGNVFIFADKHLSSIATSTDVERVFSQGRILLSHIRNRLSAQTTRALMCVGDWSLLGFVKDKDIQAVTVEEELDGEEEDLPDGWDKI